LTIASPNYVSEYDLTRLRQRTLLLENHSVEQIQKDEDFWCPLVVALQRQLIAARTFCMELTTRLREAQSRQRQTNMQQNVSADTVDEYDLITFSGENLPSSSSDGPTVTRHDEIVQNDAKSTDSENIADFVTKRPLDNTNGSIITLRPSSNNEF
jgi:hypothetical protein